MLMKGVFLKHNPMTDRTDYLWLNHSSTDMFEKSWASISKRPVKQEGKQQGKKEGEHEGEHEGEQEGEQAGKQEGKQKKRCADGDPGAKPDAKRRTFRT
jgi:hypothetical protein